MGATVGQIIYLFSREFILLVIAAFLVAAPLGYYFMKRWLENFSNHIEISWWVFALAALLGLIVAGFTTGFKSMKAAMTNPVDSLRNE